MTTGWIVQHSASGCRATGSWPDPAHLHAQRDAVNVGAELLHSQLDLADLPRGRGRGCRVAMRPAVPGSDRAIGAGLGLWAQRQWLQLTA